MEKETWKTITWLEGYEGLYSISNTGNLKLKYLVDKWLNR